MKIIKAGSVLLLMMMFAISTTHASGIGESKSDLNSQLVQEVKRSIENPLLIFSDKNLFGTASVIARVNEDGKIQFLSVRSGNINLKRNIERKLDRLNLWTDPQLEGETFVYRVKYKER